jgi:hypothetical protein
VTILAIAIATYLLVGAGLGIYWHRPRGVLWVVVAINAFIWPFALWVGESRYPRPSETPHEHATSLGSPRLHEGPAFLRPEGLSVEEG